MLSTPMTDAEMIAAMRRRDRVTGDVQPWFTHPALDVVEKWNLRGTSVLEWGGGASTAWWANRVGPDGRVLTIEYGDTRTLDAVTSDAWLEYMKATAHANSHVTLRVCANDTYLTVSAAHAWDVVVVDGDPTCLRTACIRVALMLPRPLVLIVDNWQQDHVYVDPAAEQIMAPFTGDFFTQPNHTDHDGRPWRTAIWRLT